MSTRKIDPPPPDHMDRLSRTERLYERLKGMGLYVCPIYADGQIDSLHVAVELPACSVEEATEAGIITPVERPQVGEVVASSEGTGPTVVDFPTVLEALEARE
jgi:hypothetical protein